MYLFLAVLGLRFCVRAFSSCGKRGPLFIAVRGPLLLRSTGSRRAGSVVVAHGPSCSAACGIFPDQGLNPCPLHQQADSQPLRHQGSPKILYFLKCKNFRKSSIIQATESILIAFSLFFFLNNQLGPFCILRRRMVQCRGRIRVGARSVWRETPKGDVQK